MVLTAGNDTSLQTWTACIKTFPSDDILDNCYSAGKGNCFILLEG